MLHRCESLLPTSQKKEERVPKKSKEGLCITNNGPQYDIRHKTKVNLVEMTKLKGRGVDGSICAIESQKRHVENKTFEPCIN